MAESVKKKTRVITLPMLEGENVSQQEFVSLNFKNYIIKRGEPVEVPEAIALQLEANEAARQAAMKKAAELKLKEPSPA